MICITTIIGYFLKYIINLSIMGKYETYLEKYMDISGCANDNACYNKIFIDKNLTNSNSLLFEKLKKQYHDDGFYLFLIALSIYIFSIGISIGLYSIFVTIFTKNKKSNSVAGNTFRVFKICGYTIYSENMILNKKTRCCESCSLLCSTLKNYIYMVSHSLSRNLCNICGVCDFFGDINCYCNSCNCNCEEYDIKDYEKNKEFFCYCYQAKRKQSWCKKMLISEIQKNIFPYMVEYFILQLLTIGFEKQYLNFEDNNLSDNLANDQNLILNYKITDFYMFGTFIGTFFLFFYLTLSMNTINEWEHIDENIESDKEKEIKIIDENNGDNIKYRKSQIQIGKLSNGILDGALALILFDGLYALIFTPLYFSNKEPEIFTNIIFFMVPILMNKFYHFTLIYYCISFSEIKNKFDLISGSTLISIYLFLWDIIISLLRDYTPLTALYIIQIIVGIFPGFCILMVIILFFYYTLHPRTECSLRLSYLCCYFSFICLLGGLWCNKQIYENVGDFIYALFCCECDMDYKCTCNCCDFDCYCCFDLLNYFKCFDHCNSYLCSCCNCCECYDYFGCCSCFYCCGEMCHCYRQAWEDCCHDCLRCCYPLMFWRDNFHY